MNSGRNVSLLLANSYARIITQITTRSVSNSTRSAVRSWKSLAEKSDGNNGNASQSGGSKSAAMLALSVTGVLQYFRSQDKDPFEELEKCQQYIMDGNIVRAESILKHTLVHTKNDVVSLRSKELLADIAAERRQYEKAEQLIRENVQEMIRRGYDKQNPRLIRSQLKLAKLLEQRFHYRDAENIYRLYINSLPSKILPSSSGNEQKNEEELQNLWLDFTTQYAEYHSKMENLNEALDYSQKSYDLCVSLYGENSDKLIYILSNLGKFSFLKGDLEKSSEYLQKAREIGKLYPDTKELSVVYTYLGNLALKRGLLTEANKYCDSALDYATRHMVSDYISEASLCLMNVTNAMH